MLYSMLRNKNYMYLCIHAEEALRIPSQTFRNDFSQNDSEYNNTRGIYTTTLSAITIDEIKNEKIEQNFIVDFKNIRDIGMNNLISFRDVINRLIASNKYVILINLCNELTRLFEDVLNNKQIPFDKIIQPENGYSICINTKKRKLFQNYEEIQKGIDELHEDEIRRVVENCSDDNESRCHTSSPVYLDRYIDVKQMINSSNRIFHYFIYLLAQKMINKGIIAQSYEQNQNKLLFFHNMNGSYIATLLCLLTRINMVYLDHLGPVTAVHRKNFQNSINDKYEYIIISDIVCMGSEIGRAQTIIEYNGGQYIGNVCVADVETVVSDVDKRRISLTTIKASCNYVKYTIRTEFCNNCERNR